MLVEAAFFFVLQEGRKIITSIKDSSYDCLVVGAGVIGCSIAYYLSKAGYRVGLIDRGHVACQASEAGAGMLVPLAEAHHSVGIQHPFFHLCVAGLRCYVDLDQQLQDETGIDIELVKLPTLYPAIDEDAVTELRQMMQAYAAFFPDLEWVDGQIACEVEPVLSSDILGACISPTEHNVQGKRLAQAYARGAAFHGARIIEGCEVHRLIREGQRITGADTERGALIAEHVVLATGAWLSSWHRADLSSSLFPMKGQMLALRPSASLRPHHTIYTHKGCYLVPKTDGSVYVGATSQYKGYDKTVTVDGIMTLFRGMSEVAPALTEGQFERAWTGLRPGSRDELPLLGPCSQTQGLWIAGGHFRNGILLAPITGLIIAALMQGKPVPFDLDLAAFQPDRFGIW